jgi:hypothetical protein
VAGEPLRREELLVAIGQVELTMSRLQAEQQAAHKLRVSLQYELDKLGESSERYARYHSRALQ